MTVHDHFAYSTIARRIHAHKLLEIYGRINCSKVIQDSAMWVI